MLERSTKLWLAVYAVYTLAFLAFVRTPSPALIVTGEPKLLSQPAGASLFELHVFPGDRRALVGVATEAGGELWLLDWTRIDAWLRGDAGLEDLTLARLPASNMPRYVTELDDGALGMLIGTREDGPEWVRWAPPAEPTREALPPDTAWVGDDGRPITVDELARRLDRFDRPFPDLAFVARGIAHMRIDAAPGPEYDAYLRDDDLLLFDAASGELITRVDTVKLAWTTSVSRVRGVVYATNDAGALESWICDDAGRCEETLRVPYVGSKHEGICGVDIAPERARAVVCTHDGYLMLYTWGHDTGEETAFLGQTPLDQPCSRPILVDERRVLVDQGETWSVVEFAPRGGWL